MAKPCLFLYCKIKSFHFLGLFLLVCHLTIQLQIALNELNSQMEFYTSFSKISSEEDSLSFIGTHLKVCGVLQLDGLMYRKENRLVWYGDWTLRRHLSDTYSYVFC